MGIPGNERADERAKFFTQVVRPEVLTAGGKQNTPKWVGAPQLGRKMERNADGVVMRMGIMSFLLDYD